MSSPRQQAAHWFTRLLDLPADHPEREAFARWLAADPRHADEYRAFDELWGNFSSTRQSQHMAAAIEGLGRRRLLRNGALGGLVLALCGGGWLTLRTRQAEQMLMTAIGEQRTVVLDDGSTLTLDADTQAHVLYSEASRQVFLLRGRMIFDVQSAPNRPFIVDAGAAQVRVLGTRFVVERLEPQVRVSVARGKVAFSSGAQHVLLEREQVAELDENGQLHRLQRAASNAFGFTEGRLIFESANLGEIAASVSRYRQQPLRAQVPNTQSITAVVRIADLEHFVTLLPTLADVRLEQADGVTLLLPR